MSRKYNHYDNLSVDINELFEKHVHTHEKRSRNKLVRLISRYWSAFLIKLNLYEVFVEIGLIKYWFVEFKKYWSECLGGRPIYLHDFYFLLGVYRMKFSEVVTPDYASNDDFLTSWQSNQTIYMLFGAVRRFSRTPLISRQFEKFLSDVDSVLEYGCGLAPITSSILRVGKKNNLDLTIADIRQLNFHYARYKLGSLVSSFEIKPNTIEDFPKTYDAIIMITVMEHLPNPFATVKNITKHLKSGGILFFDYHADDAKGQDTIEAVEQKKDVLDYISLNYEILRGSIDYDNIMGITVAKKK